MHALMAGCRERRESREGGGGGGGGGACSECNRSHAAAARPADKQARVLQLGLSLKH